VTKIRVYWSGESKWSSWHVAEYSRTGLHCKGNYVSFEMSVVLTEECNVTVNSGEVIGTTGYQTL
jgi:hypothetical protein